MIPRATGEHEHGKEVGNKHDAQFGAPAPNMDDVGSTIGDADKPGKRRPGGCGETQQGGGVAQVWARPQRKADGSADERGP